MYPLQVSTGNYSGIFTRKEFHLNCSFFPATFLKSFAYMMTRNNEKNEIKIKTVTQPGLLDDAFNHINLDG